MQGMCDAQPASATCARAATTHPTMTQKAPGTLPDVALLACSRKPPGQTNDYVHMYIQFLFSPTADFARFSSSGKAGTDAKQQSKETFLTQTLYLIISIIYGF
mmetsp:Transcript_42518/g.92402  ORF Transcript_42518/g.92402 Transcript_42518/m.92402 type:complete len:103 (-) Transcript_42518:136-444(-)